ncbi:hypothetical protein M3J09_009174 [Ascochyta lentis]
MLSSTCKGSRKEKKFLTTKASQANLSGGTITAQQQTVDLVADQQAAACTVLSCTKHQVTP